MADSITPVWSVDEADLGGAWRLDTSTPGFPALSTFGCVAYDGRAVVVAGSHDGEAQNSVWASAGGAPGLAWVNVTEAPFTARSGPQTAVYNARVVLCGGSPPTNDGASHEP